MFNSDGKPVLIVEVKDDSWAQKAELRYRADKQMRDRYGLMLDDCPTPRLWGLSVLGSGNPSGYPSPKAFVARPLPIVLDGEWDLDLRRCQNRYSLKGLH